MVSPGAVRPSSRLVAASLPVISDQMYANVMPVNRKKYK